LNANNVRGTTPRNDLPKLAIRTLPARERALLRLYIDRAASTREMAAALGISRSTVRRWIRRARDRATDPVRMALLKHWQKLSPQDLRLAFYHLVRGLSLRRIARDGLVGEPGVRHRGASAASLSRRMRRIRRKIERAEARAGTRRETRRQERTR
jgi:DNA-binding CsgD family transcriptional regulator